MIQSPKQNKILTDYEQSIIIRLGGHFDDEYCSFITDTYNYINTTSNEKGNLYIESSS